ncbi:TPA: hypothetical protein HA265_05080 [Candidatus Woesearchaeota archaeon]|nr:hypothetical protein [Candidatus Woesearchaeota archaeon]
MKVLNLIQLIFEVFVALGFLIGLYPFGYLLTLWWVIPLAIVNFIFSIVSRNKTFAYTLVNIFMSWLALIPVIGWAPRLIGCFMSIISIIKISKND